VNVNAIKMIDSPGALPLPCPAGRPGQRAGRRPGIAEIRNAEKAISTPARAAQKPQIPACGADNRPRGKEPEIPENATENAPPDEKLHEIRNAEKAMAKTGRKAKRPQIPERREENRPRDKKRQISENGGQNAPPDEKLQENRKAEKAVTNTGRKAKRPQIPAFREENRLPDTQPQISPSGDQNANPAPALPNAYPRGIVPSG
jgi:hypothetical protein